MTTKLYAGNSQDFQPSVELSSRTADEENLFWIIIGGVIVGVALGSIANAACKAKLGGWYCIK